jgi:alanyl-tRNA synthetase
MDTTEIRQRFVDYYKDIGYQSLPSSPMIDSSIPMSFVMSAGLVQVENSLARSTKREGNRYVLVQNCFRHFDLEKIGTDDIHLSLFEMPGAFVFGPDGKAGTVERMWRLATSVLGLEKEHIWVTYFKGGKVIEDNLPEDTATHQAWLDVGLAPNRIVGLGKDSNYWIQGKGIEDTSISRKCGPNTELFFDRGLKRACGPNCMPGCKCGRFIELSNSLFISHEIKQNNRYLTPLANPFTETVIGTERVAMVKQGSLSVFETDMFKPLVEIIRQFVHKTLPAEALATHERVIADHLRALTFLIADGAPPPGKDGRGRLIKILIRRILTRQIILGIAADEFIPPIIHRIFQWAARDNESGIEEKVVEYFLYESQRFFKTIERGQHQLAKLLEMNDGRTLSGPQIVYLEKKCGFPTLLTRQILQKQGLPFLEAEYQETLEAYNTKHRYIN